MDEDGVRACSGVLLSHKKDEIMPSVATWVDLEMVILSEDLEMVTLSEVGPRDGHTK